MSDNSECFLKYINDFLTYLTEVNGCKENTIIAYRRDLNRFCKYVVGLGVKSYADISERNITEFKTYLGAEMLSSPSISRAISSVRSFFQYLQSLGVIDYNPSKNVRTIITYKRLPILFTRGEIDALLSQPSGDDFKSVRDKALLEMLYGTGLKASEIIQMNVGDVNLPLAYITCVRGGIECKIPLHSELERDLSRYILSVRNLLVSSREEQALFVNLSGERISRQGVWKLLKQYAYQAGITVRMTPHMLRYSFALHMLENGIDIREVQTIIGHSDLSSTQRYIQLYRELKKSDYMVLHPREDLQGLEL